MSPGECFVHMCDGVNHGVKGERGICRKPFDPHCPNTQQMNWTDLYFHTRAGESLFS